MDADGAGRVVRLDLRDNGLVGSIPVEIGNLSELAVLNLAGNELTGSVPRELGDLRQLDTFILRRNQLEGAVPAALAKLVDLRILRLGYNRFQGTIPAWLGSLTKLERLDLKRNKMEGPIPPELGALTELQTLDLAGGGFSGPVPPELGNLVNLRLLNLRHNRLEGALPVQFGVLTELEHLYIEGTALTGEMPATMLNLAKLHRMLWHNMSGFCVPGTTRFLRWLDQIEQWTGPVCGAEDMDVLARFFQDAGGPSWISSRGWLDAELPIDRHGATTDTTGRVVSIDLEGNGLEGRLHPDLGRLANLRVLRVGDNHLFGEIPTTLSDTPLHELSYVGTALCLESEEVVEWVARLPYHKGRNQLCDKSDVDRSILYVLYMRNGGDRWSWRRNWRSRLPVGEWAGVETNADGRVVGLRLSGIGLTGTLPPELGDLDQLRTLDLGGNALSGPIPPELGNLQALEVLALDWNIRWGRGRGTERHDPGIVGPLPKELGNLVNLRELRLEFNKIDGDIPRTFGALRSLEYLNLSKNNLQGVIPPDLGGRLRSRKFSPRTTT